MRGYNFHLPGAGLYHYSAKELLAVFSPWFFGRSAPGAAFFHPPELSAGFTGLIPGYAQSALPWIAPAIGIIFLPLLALAAIELNKLPRTYLIWFAWLVFFLGLSFGLPLFHLLGLVRPFSFSGNFKHPWPALILSACLISAWALEKIFSEKIVPRKILFAIIASVIMLAVFFPYSQARIALKSAVILEVGFVVVFMGWILLEPGIEMAERVWVRPGLPGPDVERGLAHLLAGAGISELQHHPAPGEPHFFRFAPRTNSRGSILTAKFFRPTSTSCWMSRN